ncbi:MAG TPA: GTPase ObgE [Longimicrobiales bacterium]|nr:GTPase ObgE [Longimicrobiales bacterium]
MFIDKVSINVYGGPGGAGAEAFLRDANTRMGGPSGGTGGRGGSVILRVDSQLGTLLDYRYQEHHKAERGYHGEGSNRTGRSGEDLVLRVPPGTVVTDAETGAALGELLEDGDELVVARGGRGGRGNAAFATPTHRSPREWEPGEQGEERRITLELKLIADVGLVGFPNAGKSTLLAAVSAARPKVADYPFTTLQPHLGVVGLSDGRSFVLADIPGIIEGAHEGRGLGLQFLRHIERTRTLAFLLPAEAGDPAAEYATLRGEIEAHSGALAKKPHCVVITKADLLPDRDAAPLVDAPDAWGVFVVSAVTGSGVQAWKEATWNRVRDEVRAEWSEGAEPEPWRP